MATIAAQSQFAEPFVTGPSQRRLGWQHKSLCGRRCSDHVAMLNAFQMWHDAREAGESCELALCEQKNLNNQILRMVAEAKRQILDILTSAGFPDECRMPLTFNYTGANDARLDVVVTLLCVALYPNVCWHWEKRKVKTSEGKLALVHKSSVNCNNRAVVFDSPFFIFSEKLRTRAISCKQMSMVNPLQMLLFAARKVESTGSLVRLDEWIGLTMPHQLAAGLVALRPALEGLIVSACTDPQCVIEQSPENQQLLDLVRSFSKISAARYGLATPTSADADGTGPLSKRGRGAPLHGGGIPGGAVCFNCGEPDHFSRECPHPPSRMRPGRGFGGRGGGGGGAMPMGPVGSREPGDSTVTPLMEASPAGLGRSARPLGVGNASDTVFGQGPGGGGYAGVRGRGFPLGGGGGGGGAMRGNMGGAAPLMGRRGRGLTGVARGAAPFRSDAFSNEEFYGSDFGNGAGAMGGMMGARRGARGVRSRGRGVGGGSAGNVFDGSLESALVEDALENDGGANYQTFANAPSDGTAPPPSDSGYGFGEDEFDSGYGVS